MRPTRPLAAPLFLAAALTIANAPGAAKVTRYLTGNAADVDPALAGPAHDLGGGSTDVDAALQWMINEVRGCTGCATQVDVVILRSSGADGYVDKMGRATVMGAGPVYFILADHAVGTFAGEVCAARTPLTYRGYKLWRLGPGETFDLRNRPSSGYYSVDVVGGMITSNPY